MAYDVRQWPGTSVYPFEVNDECPEAMADIDVLILKMGEQGPSPDGYKNKALGQKNGGLWQINLKVNNRQIRVLYAPYGKTIVLFQIHKKSSPQKQARAYELAKKRKREYELTKETAGKKSHDRDRRLH